MVQIGWEREEWLSHCGSSFSPVRSALPVAVSPEPIAARNPMCLRYTVIGPDTNILRPITFVSSLTKSADPGCDLID